MECNAEHLSLELSLPVLWRLGFEHRTFHLQSKSSNKLHHRRGCNVRIDALRDKERNPNAIMLQDRIFCLFVLSFSSHGKIIHLYRDNIPEYAFDFVLLLVVASHRYNSMSLIKVNAVRSFHQ